MDDRMAFTATYSGLRSLVDGDYRISFDIPGVQIKLALEVLTQGGVPSAAKGTWFAIARLNTGGTGEHRDNSLKSGSYALTSETNSTEGAAPELKPVRSLSNLVYLRLCNQPIGRHFLEEFCQDIVRGQKINDAESAKTIVKRRLGIESLSQVDGNPVVSEQAEQFLNMFEGWKRGYDKAS